MKKILLTGGSGFIGRNIQESFLAERYTIVAPSSRDLDCTDTDRVDAFFSEQSYDVILHAGAKPGHRNAPDPTQLLSTNSRLFFNLVRQVERGRAGRLINLGSGAIYGMEHYQPLMTESYFGVHLPQDEHGYTKYLCGKFMEESSLDLVDLRIFGIFGKYEDYAIRFISNAICKTLFGLPITLRQDRDFSYLYVDDLMPVLDFFIRNKPQHRAYNVTPSEVASISLLDLAHRISALSGADPEIRVHLSGKGLPYTGDCTRLLCEIPTWSSRPLDASISALYTWYREHQSTLKRETLLNDR